QGDRAPDQGLEGARAGLDPGGPGPRGRQEPRRPPEDHRDAERKGSRHRAPVHELPQRLTVDQHGRSRRPPPNPPRSETARRSRPPVPRTDQHDRAREHLALAAAMYRDMGMSYWLANAGGVRRELE